MATADIDTVALLRDAGFTPVRLWKALGLRVMGVMLVYAGLLVFASVMDEEGWLYIGFVLLVLAGLGVWRFVSGFQAHADEAWREGVRRCLTGHARRVAEHEDVLGKLDIYGQKPVSDIVHRHRISLGAYVARVEDARLRLADLQARHAALERAFEAAFTPPPQWGDIWVSQPMRWQLQWACLQDTLRPLMADGQQWSADVDALAALCKDLYGDDAVAG